MGTTSQGAAVDVDAHVAAIAQQGYTVVEDASAPDLVDELVDDLTRLEQELAAVPATNSFEGTKTVRIYNLLARGPLYEQVPVHPAVLPIVEGVLDPGCLISSLSSIAIDPGEVAQPIHADDQLMPIPKPHVPTVCNSMWALTDFTEANGATRILPGTHHAVDSPEYGAAFDSIPAEMAKGSVLIWHGSLWHGGGANRTDERRMGLAMNYCAGWIRQQENQQLGIPLETVRTFRARLRRLCGFGIYNGLMGHIDKQDPAKVLLGPAPDDSGADGMVWDDI